LAADNGKIVVYEGQPQGVLWFKPEVVTTTNFSTKDLQPLDQKNLAATISEPSLSEALSEASYLHKLWLMGQSTTTTTTTTTTTKSSTVTTTAATSG
jgi:hypothetical protein